MVTVARLEDFTSLHQCPTTTTTLTDSRSTDADNEKTERGGPITLHTNTQQSTHGLTAHTAQRDHHSTTTGTQRPHYADDQNKTTKIQIVIMELHVAGCSTRLIHYAARVPITTGTAFQNACCERWAGMRRKWPGPLRMRLAVGESAAEFGQRTRKMHADGCRKLIRGVLCSVFCMIFRGLWSPNRRREGRRGAAGLADMNG